MTGPNKTTRYLQKPRQARLLKNRHPDRSVRKNRMRIMALCFSLVALTSCRVTEPPPVPVAARPVVSLKTPAPSVVTQATEIDVTQAATYRSGDWRYEFKIRGGLRDGLPVGSFGTLHFGNTDLCQTILAGRHQNDRFFVSTPWGKLYWVHYPRMIYGPHGFVPAKLLSGVPPKKEIQVDQFVKKKRSTEQPDRSAFFETREK